MFSYLDITNCCAKLLQNEKLVPLKNDNTYKMGRNNPKNIKAHNDKLHKEQAKEKAKKNARAEKLKEITRKFNESKQ